MKRVKSVNGYTIYQATSARDYENHNCRFGNYNIYLSSDIRDYGLTNSYAEYDDVETLTEALNICNASQFAIACALADELSDSTIQDMDLALEIERRLDAGEAVNTIRDCYDRETGILYASVGEAINAGYEPFMDDYAAALADDMDPVDDDDDQFDPDGLLDSGLDLEDIFAAAMAETEEEPARSHATYYVVKTEDGEYITRTVDSSYGTMEGRKRAFFRTVAERLAFSDCSYDTVEEIVYDGRPCHYAGWKPGMLYEFIDTNTHEIIFSEHHHEWNH